MLAAVKYVLNNEKMSLPNVVTMQRRISFLYDLLKISFQFDCIFLMFTFQFQFTISYLKTLSELVVGDLLPLNYLLKYNIKKLNSHLLQTLKMLMVHSLKTEIQREQQRDSLQYLSPTNISIGSRFIIKRIIYIFVDKTFRNLQVNF